MNVHYFSQIFHEKVPKMPRNHTQQENQVLENSLMNLFQEHRDNYNLGTNETKIVNSKNKNDFIFLWYFSTLYIKVNIRHRYIQPGT